MHIGKCRSDLGGNIHTRNRFADHAVIGMFFKRDFRIDFHLKAFGAEQIAVSHLA